VKNLFLLTLTLFTSAVTSGCASLANKHGGAEMAGSTEARDPFESYNRAIHNFNEGFDRTIARPVARAYRNVMPDWADKGVTNFFGNLDDVRVLANNLLQFKFQQAASDSARIFFNTTIGLLGFFDVASHMGFRKHHEDFGQTLGYWGVPSGPYFVLPFFGPSTIRDTAGLGADYAYFDPLLRNVRRSGSRNALFLTDFVDTRADLLDASQLLEAAALDPYVYVREAYLQRRQYYVYDGDPPMDDFEEQDR